MNEGSFLYMVGVFYRFLDAGGTLGVKIVFYYGNKGNSERQNSTL